MTKYNQNTGAPYEVCDRCYQRRDTLQTRNEDDGQAPTAPVETPVLEQHASAENAPDGGR